MTASNTTLQLINNTLLSPVSLTNGVRYWVAASTVGQSGGSGLAYQVGGHTQGVDLGTFWYSNDPAGQNFDGRSQTPEMAIFVGSGVSVPEPATYTLLLAGFAVAALRRRRA